MRPTLLNFRSPAERTPDFASTAVNREGKKFDVCEDRPANPKGSTLPRNSRFEQIAFYDTRTGQSVFLGPGSYNPQVSFNILNQSPC